MFYAIAFLALGLWQHKKGSWLNIVYIGLGFALIGMMAIKAVLPFVYFLHFYSLW